MKWIKKLWLAVAFIFLYLPLSAKHNTHKNIIGRVNAIRKSIKSERSADKTNIFYDASGVYKKSDWVNWNNWGNWNNWNNWSNWAKWNNWGNWGNWGNY